MLTQPDRNDGEVDANPPGIGFWALVAEDRAAQEHGLLSQGFWALFWHRVGNRRLSFRVKPIRVALWILYRVMTGLGERSAGISLPYTVVVGRRVRIEHFGGMVLVAQKIGDDVTIRQNTTFGIARTSEPQQRPVIGNGVDIGAGAVIVGAITIGDGAVIGANAVVVSDVPPGATVGGVPARILKTKARG